MRFITGLLLLFCLMTGCSKEPVIKDIQNHPVRLSQMQGKWVIVNYWAAWCESCVKEIPELNHFYQHHQNKNILLFGVNYDALPLADLKKEIKRLKINFPVLQENPTTLWSLGNIEYVPTTIVINPEGKVVKKILGPNTEETLIEVLS